MMSSTKIRST